jgi:4'-phosphopantetheinyl transferase
LRRAKEIVVDVWYVAPPGLDEQDLAACDAVLSEEERASVRRFVSEANQRERRAARALVRAVLARYRPFDPTSWQFRTGRWGKPEIDPLGALRFNLAHHPTLVVCAVTEGREVGIDVEPLSRSAAIAEVAETVFAPAELAELATLEDTERADRAVTLWTLKEAYIKARGMGLSLPLRDLAFRFDAPSPRLVTGETVDPEPARWAFATTDIEGHRIAVALDAPNATLRLQLCAWAPASPGS